jgi:hypothetical protein
MARFFCGATSAVFQPPNARSSSGCSCFIVTSPVTMMVLLFGTNQVRCHSARSVRLSGVMVFS